MGWSGALFAVFQIGLVVVIGGAALLLASRSASRTHRLLLGAGDALGLEEIHAGKLTKSAVFGNVDGFSLKVEMSPQGRLVIEIDGGGVISPLLRIETGQTLLVYGQQLLVHGMGQGLYYGDVPERAPHQVSGPDPVILGRFDERARKLLVHPPSGGTFRLLDSTLRLEVKRGAYARQDVVALVRMLVSLAASLDEGASTVPEALLARVEHDPDPWARARSLEILHERLPTTPQTREAFEVAASDEADEVRLVSWSVGCCDSPNGLARRMGNVDLASSLRLGAIRRLARREDASAFVAPLSTLLTSQDHSTACESINTLGMIALPDNVEVFRAVLDGGRKSALPILATTLGAHGDIRAEPMLIEMLASEHGAVQSAALMALGRVGEDAALDAIGAYLDALMNGPLEGVDYLRGTAKNAQKKIRGRLGRTDGGRLSVMELEPEGALDYSDAPPRGAVSDPDRA